jgi:hypothetical protein
VSTTKPSHEQLELPFAVASFVTGQDVQNLEQPGAQIIQFPATIGRAVASGNQAVDAELLSRIVERVRFF